MKIAIMQPYFFPYIGYWQLINSVDKFIIYDDVNFIMRGWINRNNILLDGKAHLFSVPLEKPSQNKLICETKLGFSEKEKKRFLKTFQMAYKKAPYFKEFYPVLERIINYNSDDLTEFIHNSFVMTLSYLDIKKTIVRSSTIVKDHQNKAQDKIIDICNQMQTQLYINPIGGKQLYQKEAFDRKGIELKFIDTLFGNIHYKQFDFEFIQGLSFLDVLMFNSKEDVKKLLEQYRLVD